MARSERQKALNGILFRAMELHLMEWPSTTFTEALQVLRDMQYALDVQSKTAERTTIKPKEE